MDFAFQGFQNGLPLWTYILLLISTTTLSWWSYRDFRSIRSFYRYFLISLRSLVFLILLILLLNPFFKAEFTYHKKPGILVLLDNSASTSIQKGNYKGENSYRELLNNLQLRDSSQISYSFFSIDKDIRSSSPDSLDFQGRFTDLYRAIQKIKNVKDEISATILISDGIFNHGRDPTYESGTSEVPIYTIAVGDTSQQKDLIVKNIESNSKGYLNTRHPVGVTVLSNGYSGQPFQVHIKKGDKILGTQTVTPSSDIASNILNFKIDLKEEGLQQYNIEIPSSAQEWTDENNNQLFSVDVLDDKQHVLSLAFEVYPDIRFIRSLLLQDNNTSLIARTWIGGNRFIEGSFKFSPDSLDLIILHGYPRQGFEGPQKDQLADLLQKVPSVICFTPSASLNALNDIPGVSLPLTSSGSLEVARVIPTRSVSSTSHPIMELPAVNTDRLPALTASVRNLRLNPGSNKLFGSSFHNIDTKQPLIAVHETGNIRRTEITGYGWFQIGQSSNKQNREFVQQLFYNIINWTSAHPDNRKLNIQPAQKVFTTGEPVILNAFLTNESSEQESEATIEISVRSETMERKYYSMDNLGNGQYRLSLNSLPQGIYHFEASARKGTRLIEHRQGDFPVTNSSIEYVNTRRNDMLLKQIASRSGGTFFTYDNIADFWETLDQKGVLKKIEKVKDKLFYPYQHVLWFIFVLLLLSAEWIIRKYFALP